MEGATNKAKAGTVSGQGAVKKALGAGSKPSDIGLR